MLYSTMAGYIRDDILIIKLGSSQRHGAHERNIGANLVRESVTTLGNHASTEHWSYLVPAATVFHLELIQIGLTCNAAATGNVDAYGYIVFDPNDGAAVSMLRIQIGGVAPGIPAQNAIIQDMIFEPGDILRYYTFNGGLTAGSVNHFGFMTGYEFTRF